MLRFMDISLHLGSETEKTWELNKVKEHYEEEHELMEKNTRDEAATEGTGTGTGTGQDRNPISNDNPNPSPTSNSSPNPNPNHPRTIRGSKGKSCKGYTYYTSIHKAKSKNPTCVGISRTLDQVPPFRGKTELEATKEGRSLANFKYACIGYAVYLDNKDSSADSQDKTAQLPFCFGLEAVLEEKGSTSPAGHVPATQKNEEHEHAAAQLRKYKAPNATANEFLDRFKRNANLVASGVVKNLNRVGNYVKETLEDVLNRRPK
ncbi:hypothetical protein RJT34_31842 [Clitoria ternatea]|uniref:DUF8204 domain-containing protein n=1 Tax=Clitoria ternatea TaxID=43366 RepID=A0AAN9I8T6_CLITE